MSKLHTVFTFPISNSIHEPFPYVDQRVSLFKSKMDDGGNLVSDALADTAWIFVSLQDPKLAVARGKDASLVEDTSSMTIRNSPMNLRGIVNVIYQSIGETSL